MTNPSVCEAEEIDILLETEAELFTVFFCGETEGELELLELEPVPPELDAELEAAEETLVADIEAPAKLEACTGPLFPLGVFQ